MSADRTVLFANQDAGAVADVPASPRAPLQFHRALPGYAPTPLRELPSLASRLGVGRVWAKDETSRFGLPAFKILGASWAVERALAGRTGVTRLVAATDGNHGRAVARMARLRGLDAHIVVPDDMVPARRHGIVAEGASLEVIDGSYDDAVARSATYESDTTAVVSDTSWPGYEEVPAAVIDGYSTLMWEVDAELTERGAPTPDVVVVPVGVGALAAAVVRRARGPEGWGARVIAVEPLDAACALESVRAGTPTEVPAPHRSVMAGLNCGNISPLAWPALRTGVDVFAAIPDRAALDGMAALAAEGIDAGECSGASVGALLELEQHDRALAAALGLGAASSVLVLLTEGPTGRD